MIVVKGPLPVQKEIKDENSLKGLYSTVQFKGTVQYSTV